MRTILVGVLAVMVAVAGPAFAGPCAMAKRCDRGATDVGGAVHFTNPTARVVQERRHGAGAEFGLAVAATSISILYFPVRMVYGVIGAGLGGFGGWTTGGDMRTAKGLWRPTTEGHYFVRPDYLDGTERFRFCGAVPAYREPDVVEERVVTSHEMVYEPAPGSGVVEPAPAVEPESPDTDDNTL
jgi:hypothetical protein